MYNNVNKKAQKLDTLYRDNEVYKLYFLSSKREFNSKYFVKSMFHSEYRLSHQVRLLQNLVHPLEATVLYRSPGNFVCLDDILVKFEYGQCRVKN